ncbi:2-succinylbenzoate--CoA ligase [Streptomyces collinus]|nr:2-succinylbenzoate--CoA ligase [Streptomyces collinus]UJA12423.1 2-succinylbenzoate--CoA ligase [Streptomyces collinus]
MTQRHSSTVDGVLRRSARRTPARVALEYGERSWTYGELDDAVSRAAGLLLAEGLAPGDRVAAYGHNSDAYVLAFLGCARAGLVHVPVNQNLTGDDLAYLLGQSGSTLVLTDPDLAGRLPDGARALPLRDTADSFLTRLADAPPYDGPGPRTEDLVQLLYTSGTTALPKGAMMTHRALVHEYLSAITALDLSAGDRPVHALPLYHSAQMHVFLLPYLAVGATNIVLDAPDGDRLLDLVEAGRVDSLFAPPTVWIALANRSDFAVRDLGGLRKAYYGASVMPVPVLRRLRERLPGLAFYNCFGQSEIGPLATVLGPDEHEGRLDSCGRTVLFVDARVVDDKGEDVPVRSSKKASRSTSRWGSGSRASACRTTTRSSTASGPGATVPPVSSSAEPAAATRSARRVRADRASTIRRRAMPTIHPASGPRSGRYPCRPRHTPRNTCCVTSSASRASPSDRRARPYTSPDQRRCTAIRHASSPATRPRASSSSAYGPPYGPPCASPPPTGRVVAAAAVAGAGRSATTLLEAGFEHMPRLLG